MSSRSPSPMEQGEIEASPDLNGSPGIILDPDDDYSSRQNVRSSDKEKSGKVKHDSRSPDRHEDVDDVLNIQPPQIAHLKKDKHRHHRHGKGDSHKRSTREADKYLADNRHGHDDRQIRKYEDKPRGKHSKREPEMSSSSREFAKQQMQQEREVEALRRQKSQQERERLERLERERYRIEKERQMKEREYWAKMKKSEQEQAARNEQERRQQRSERFWREEERDRQQSDELTKRRAKDLSKKAGRQRSRTRSRSPLLRPSKESEKDIRRIASEPRRDESREVRRHESWIKDKRGSDQDRDRDHDRGEFQDRDHYHDRDQEQYLRSKLYSGMNKDSIHSHEDHPEPGDDLSVASDRSESEEREQATQEARPSSVSHDESEKSHESNASQRSRSDRSQSERSREEEEEEEEQEIEANHRHSTHEDMLRSKFDDDEEEDDRRSESGDRGSRNSASSGVEDDEKDGVYLEDSPIPSSPETQLQLPPYFPALQGCRNVEEFQCLNRIEEGTYGVVYRAIDLKTEEVVALKRLKMEKEKEGFPITSLREINTLLKAQHPNIVTVREIVVGSNMDKIYIVMDYVEHDLKSLMEYMKEPFSIGEVKTLLLQLLRGVAHLHDNWIIHRDLKTSNLLLSHKGILKVGDFGLAREYGSPLRPYTPIVVTLWYRAPELLLGAKEYSTPIDLWSVGCILAEFLTRKPLFPGKSEIDQLNRIFKDLGTPNEKIWPGVSELPAMKKCTFTEYPFNQLQSKFKLLLTAKGLDMLNRFLTYNPEKRVSAEDAKRHEFFTESPLPVDPNMFPTWPAKSEQSKTRTHGNSPKPPSGGKAYAKLLGDDDEYGARFHLGGPTIGDSAKQTGFALKF